MSISRTKLARPHHGITPNVSQSPRGPKSLDDLPDEVLATIGRRLDCMAVYSTMPRVSRRWRAIVSDRALLGPSLCIKKHSDKAHTKEKKYLYAHAPTCPRRRLACADAIRAGAAPSMLFRLQKLGHKFNKDAIMAAILADDLMSLRVLRTSKTYAVEADHYNAAALHGRTDVLAYFVANEGSNWRNANVAIVAARYGHLDCLKLAHQSGIKWDVKVAVAAARGGHVDCLAYARDYGCPWDPRALYAEAKSNNREACCEYIARHTTERLTERFADESRKALALVVLVVPATVLFLVAIFFFGVSCAHLFAHKDGQ
ncbi:F-box domain containing protein [Pandoravirus salinus]|uniref:F-box domain containing protein n=1 Tax=Pandoravirus salinus TaxID=1349410 RepID=S4VWW5_9VIRU|nr:F-box domain [Pandoravirus salinus]AGO84868.1 F-box domain containing protein [Pandoravirus salinus]